jgi:translation initiation factor IF-3
MQDRSILKPRFQPNSPNSSSSGKQFINEQIRSPKIQLITHTGENIGVVPREQALRMAKEVDLDLVQISDNGDLGYPIAKIMDFGKALYLKKKKLADAKKHQKIVQVKELKIRPKIGEHDFLTKMKQAMQFLQDGKHVKVTLVFRGREIATSQQRGTELFDKMTSYLQEQGLTNVSYEKDMRAGPAWSRIYFTKR